MRTVRGVQQAREALSDARRSGQASIPPHVRARIADVFGEPLGPAAVVERIVRQVREAGDRALRDLAQRIDGVAPPVLEVSPAAIEAACRTVSPALAEALGAAAQRVREFQEAALPRSWMDFARGYGEMVTPVRRVGAYAPGGTAPYPSTVLMTAIPARVAGVEEVVVCSPPGSDGLPHPAVLLAARLAGVDRVFAIGGAQAIAAMAYGTETVPRVDLVCGPGNVFVTLAKKLVYGDVGIDGLYGPTETLIVADQTANPTLCAADLLAQAEHDTMACPVLVTISPALAEAVAREVEVRLARLDRGRIARASIEGRGCIALVDNLDEALALANWFGPEHLSLVVADPWTHVGKVRNAGAVFVGDFSHEVLGDYVAGPSHVMPTGGTARFNSGLSVRSFLKFSPVVALGREVSLGLGRTASVIARAEGLTGHAEAAEVREELADTP